MMATWHGSWQEYTVRAATMMTIISGSRAGRRATHDRQPRVQLRARVHADSLIFRQARSKTSSFSPTSLTLCRVVGPADTPRSAALTIDPSTISTRPSVSRRAAPGGRSTTSGGTATESRYVFMACSVQTMPRSIQKRLRARQKQVSHAASEQGVRGRGRASALVSKADALLGDKHTPHLLLDFCTVCKLPDGLRAWPL